ncbi:MAG: hypothetical protein AVDCRST_MAG68-4992, partial [uncultured Gemmatimonadetes bacterium]
WECGFSWMLRGTVGRRGRWSRKAPCRSSRPIPSTHGSGSSPAATSGACRTRPPGGPSGPTRRWTACATPPSPHPSRRHGD